MPRAGWLKRDIEDIAAQVGSETPRAARARVTWLLPMIWMEDDVAMRNRGSSRKKLRIRVARRNRPPKAMTTATAARNAACPGGGMRPRLTGMRRRARRNVSSSVSGSASAGCFGRSAASGALRRDILRYFGARCRRGRRGEKNCSTGSSSANTVTRFA